MRAAPSLGLALAGLLAALPVQSEEVAAARQAYLANLLTQDCGSCHGLTMKGGLGPALLPAALAERDDAVLVETILDGRPGTPMPPWRFELSTQEAAWLVARLREGVR
ncbi:MAG: cytochrome c [Defluviicoccus sp.]